MRWPPEVLARLALNAGFNRDAAIVAVATTRRLTGGDDSYCVVGEFSGSFGYVGLYAIPAQLIHTAEMGTSMTASGNTAIARRLTGPTGTDWSWLPNGPPELRQGELDEARQAVEHPRAGVTERGPNVGADQMRELSAALETVGRIVGNVVDALGSPQPPPV